MVIPTCNLPPVMSGGQPSILIVTAMVLLPVVSGCSSPARPEVRDSSSVPTTCAEAVEAAFPDGRQGTLVAYREVIRRCRSLDELAGRSAYNGEILRYDCVPAEILKLGETIRQPGADISLPPPDLIDTPVCAQFNRECADYEEIRRDRAEVIRRPTMANRDLYVNHRARVEACNRLYSR